MPMSVSMSIERIAVGEYAILIVATIPLLINWGKISILKKIACVSVLLAAFVIFLSS